MTLKMSILLFFLSLSKTDKIFRWSIYATIFVVNAAGVALTMVNIFQCSPVSAAIWPHQMGTATCTDIVTIYLSSAPVNLITDIAIFLLPVPILTKLRLPRKQKIILIITFSFGVFTAVVDVIRVAYLQSAATSRVQMIHRAESAGLTSKLGQDFSCKQPIFFFSCGCSVLTIQGTGRSHSCGLRSKSILVSCALACPG
jgi:hypothetical protein